jgi:hypothetical protein
MRARLNTCSAVKLGVRSCLINSVMNGLVSAKTSSITLPGDAE